MNRIFRLWNKHRKGFILGIGAFVFLVLVIHFLNEMVKQQNINDNLNKQNIVLTQEEKNLPTESIIGGKNVSIDDSKQNVNLFNEFVEKCNNEDLTGAYNMLTDDCKEALFPSVELFKAGYYDIIFTEKRIVNMENFLTSQNRYTYLVKYDADLLSQGKTSSDSSYKDYITIDYNKENGKINVNSLIYREVINKEAEQYGLKLQVLYKEVYKENEKYIVKVTNNTDKRISITTGKANKDIYATDDSNVDYKSNILEIASSLYQIPAHFNKTYTLKFIKTYSYGIPTRAITFLDIVPDYNQYEISPNETKERVQVRVIF